MSVPFLGSRGARLAGLLLAVSSAGNCGGDGGDITGPPDPPGPEPVATVEVTPASASLTAGETAQLTAAVKAADGAPLTDRTVTWTTSDPAIAAVTEAGMVTAAAAGSATITATSEGKSGSASVAVQSVPVASVEVVPSPATVTVGQSAPLTAVLRDADGGELTDRPVTWTTSATAVATVSETGVVAGVAVGEATITATSEGKEGASLVTVSAVPVASVEVTPPSAAVVAGTAVQLTATAKAADGTTLAGRPPTWSTSDAAVARVGATGLVTGAAPGSTRIIATIEGKSDTATVTVTAQRVATVEVSPTQGSVAVGRTAQLTAVTKAADGSVLTGRAVAWKTSDDAIATVSGSGLVTGVAAGSAAITATSESMSGTAAITVTVTQQPVATVQVEPNTAFVEAGKSLQFTAVIKAADGSVLAGRAITWRSSAAGVARIDANGLATGLTEGTATITATSEAVDGQASLIVGPAAGVVRTWRGGTSAKPTDWSTAGNWNPAGEPIARDTVRIAPAPNPAVLAENEQIARLIIVGGRLGTAGHRLTIKKP